MAVKEVQGANVGIFVRDFGSSDAFKRLVCEDTLVFDINNDVNTKKTKCGTFKGIQVADFKVSGSGMANVTPGVAEYSLDELQVDQLAIQKKEFVLENVAYDAVTSGSEIRLQGAMYFVASQMTANNGETVNFTWNAEGSGTLNTDES